MKRTFSLPALLIACSAQTFISQNEPNTVSNEYEACCGTQPVEFSYENKSIYVPNVFTPNADGTNDYFFPSVNDVVTDVWGFAIYSVKGDTVLYQKPYFNSKMDIREYGWDGLRADGTRYTGLFKYKMRVDDKKARKHIVSGQACAIICGPDTKLFKQKRVVSFPLRQIKVESINH